MRRSRRREQRAPRRGDLVIDGCVRARLLGLPLLEIDAHVVVAPARTPPAIRRTESPSVTGTGRGSAPRSRQRAVTAPNGPSPPELDYAVRLIAEGSSLLHDATAR
jgi:hypothetical protein